MKVSVVTPNYNGERFLNAFLKSLSEDSEFIGEVIIIDNGSGDASLDYLKNNAFDFPLVLIENSENLGFAPAVNQGIKKAKNELIFSINNDTEVKKGSIKALMDLITSSEDIFSVQAKMLQYDNKDLIDPAVLRSGRMDILVEIGAYIYVVVVIRHDVQQNAQSGINARTQSAVIYRGVGSVL